MIPKPKQRFDIKDRGQAWKGRILTTLGTLGASATVWAGAGMGGETSRWELPDGTHLYSTAEAPFDYRGPVPTLLLAMLDPTAANNPRAEPRFDSSFLRAQNQAAEPNSVAAFSESEPAKSKASERETENAKEQERREVAPRVASAASRARTQSLEHPPGSTASLSTATAEASHDPIVMAKQAIADCEARYKKSSRLYVYVS